MPMNAAELDRFDRLDARLLKVAHAIHVLDALTWPRELESVFLDGWRAGRPELPHVDVVAPDLSDELDELEAIMGRCDRSHPMGDHLYKTAWSYTTAGRMLEAMGSPAFTEHSVRLYGRPGHVYDRQQLSAVDAARILLEVTDPLQHSDDVLRQEPDIPAEAFAEQLRGPLGAFFTKDTVEVLIDPAMSAKAAAGAKRVKVQAGAMFSDHDLAQLLNHEAFIHAATSLSGEHQPHLRVLGLGSPRTTRTQEGLAVFSELVTYSIDLVRLRRVALRAVAVDAALDGADFIDVFRIYLDGGQSENDAYNSAQRVFRGGDVHGGIAFTKDAVYLDGLLLVDTFLRKIIADERPDLIRILFAGRLTLGDVIELEPLFLDGTLAHARYLPAWATGLRRLSAYLAFSIVSDRIRLETVELERFSDLDASTMAQAEHSGSRPHAPDYSDSSNSS